MRKDQQTVLIGTPWEGMVTGGNYQRFNVNEMFTRNKMKQVETGEWLGMLARMIRAAGKRVGDADEHELSRLFGMRDDLDRSIRMAIDGQLRSGRSWTHVGRALGMTRQGAFRRYGQPNGCFAEPSPHHEEL